VKNSNLINWILIVILTLVIIILISYDAHSAESVEMCKQRCKSDVMQVEDCIADEKEFWETENTSDWIIMISCKDLIRNEKLQCIKDCEVKGKNYE
jgi:hypothetical protein